MSAFSHLPQAQKPLSLILQAADPHPPKPNIFSAQSVHQRFDRVLLASRVVSDDFPNTSRRGMLPLTLEFQETALFKLHFLCTSSACAASLLIACMKREAMKVHVLLGFFASAILCSCAANSPGSETMIDTSTNARQTVLPEAPRQAPLSVPIGPQ